MRKKSDNQEIKQKPKGLKILLFVVLGLVLLFFITAMILKVQMNKENGDNLSPPVPPSEVEEPIETSKQNPIEEPTNEPNELNEPDDKIDEIEEPIDINRMDYENKIIGIGFNYDTNMYLTENTDKIFNILKKSSKDKENFDINTDKIVEELEILTIKYQGEEKLTIDLAFKPISEDETEELNVESITLDIENKYKIIEELEEVDEEPSKEIIKKPNKEKEVIEEEIIEDTRIPIDSYIEITPTSLKEGSKYTTIVAEYQIVEGNKNYRKIVGYIQLGVNQLEVTVTFEGEIYGIDVNGIFERIIDSVEIIKGEV